MCLYLLRPLRGTPLDIFGYARVRREERALIEDYQRTMTEAIRSLGADTADIVLALAELPDVIRGYEQIKLDSLSRYRTRRDEILASLGASDRAAA